jgi:hypothetical protein
MRHILLLTLAVSLLIYLRAEGLTLATAELCSTEGAVDLLPSLRESTTTRLTPEQQAYGVGEICWQPYPPDYCQLWDRPKEAQFGALIGGSQAVWVIWELERLPSNAEVVRVEIEYYLTPHPYNDPDLMMQYRKLGELYLPPSDCLDAKDDLFAASVYTETEMDTLAGTRHHVLGGSAVEDVADALQSRGFFSAWLAVAASTGNGAGLVPGWSAGGPELIVTWRDPGPIEPRSWGAVKALFCP